MGILRIFIRNAKYSGSEIDYISRMITIADMYDTKISKGSRKGGIDIKKTVIAIVALMVLVGGLFVGCQINKKDIIEEKEETIEQKEITEDSSEEQKLEEFFVTVDGKKQEWLYLVGNGEDRYLRVEVEHEGKLVVQQGEISRKRIYLCDSNKKELTDGTYLFYDENLAINRAVFAVKKGTYYLKIIEANTWYSLKITNMPLVGQAGKSKEEATEIKIGSTMRGIIHIGREANQPDWYKIVVTEPQKIHIRVRAEVSNGVATWHLNSNKPVPPTTASLNGVGGINWYTMYRDRLVPKGTYYLNIRPAGPRSTVCYTIEVGENLWKTGE